MRGMYVAAAGYIMIGVLALFRIIIICTKLVNSNV